MGAAAETIALETWRHDAIASAWHSALVSMAFNGRSKTELRAEFSALTGKVVSLLSVEPLVSAEAEALGAALVDLRYAKPEALSMTLIVLSRALDDALAPLPGSPLRDRIGALLAALSAGFVRRVTAKVLLEQDQAHHTLDIARSQAVQAVHQQEGVILQQLATLKLLSTPLIPLTEEVAVMPLIGAIDAERAAQVMETVLHGIAARKTRVVIIDITGVPAVDAEVADALLRVAGAVRLLGARLLLTGIQPNIARTLVEQGVRFEGIATHGTLQRGITHVLLKRSGAASGRLGRERALARMKR